MVRIEKDTIFLEIRCTEFPEQDLEELQYAIIDQLASPYASLPDDRKLILSNLLKEMLTVSK